MVVVGDVLRNGCVEVQARLSKETENDIREDPNYVTL